jgi:hypothetical protein
MFDSLMPVALLALTLRFLYLYFKGVPSGYAKAGYLMDIARSPGKQDHFSIWQVQSNQRKP